MKSKHLDPASDERTSNHGQIRVRDQTTITETRLQ